MRLTEKLSRTIDKTPFACRPLAFLCVIFLVGLFLFYAFRILFYIFALSVVLICAVRTALECKKHGRSALKAPFCIAVLAVLLLSSLLPLYGLAQKRILLETDGEFEAVVDVKKLHYHAPYGSLYSGEVVSVNGGKCEYEVFLQYDSEAVLEPFDRVKVKCTLSEGEKFGIAEKSIILNANKTLSLDKDSRHRGFEYYIYKARSALISRLEKFLEPNTAAYASALLIGERQGLTKTFQTDMAALGLSHIIAVSGIHMSIIAMLVELLMKRVTESVKIKSAVIIICAFLFAGLAEFSASVSRAAIMLTVSLLGKILGKESDSLTSLTVSGAIICLIEPKSAVSCSFVLSFSATLGIIMCGLYIQSLASERMRRTKFESKGIIYKLLNSLVTSVVISLSATLFTVVPLALYYSSTSIVSVAVNIVAVPFSTFAMVLSVIILVIGGVPVIGTALCMGYDFIYGIFEGGVHTVARSINTGVSLRYAFFVPCVILLFSILLYFWLARVKSPLAIMSAFCAVAVIYGSLIGVWNYRSRGGTEVVYMASATNEGIFIKDGKSSIYIDIGNGGKALVLKGAKLAFDSYYETELDALVLTHYHSRHINAVKELLSTCKVEKIYLPTPETSYEADVFLSIARNAGSTKTEIYKRGRTVEFANIEIQTLPCTYIERSTHPVIGLSIEKNDKCITYLGTSVGESGACAYAEQMLSRSSAAICGLHGPVHKEPIPYISFSKDSELYIPPFCTAEELFLVFGPCKRIDMTRKTDNVYYEIFSLD